MAAYDPFDDISIEEDPGYLAYQAELEYRQWYEEIGWMEDVNAELQVAGDELREQEVSEYLLTFE